MNINIESRLFFFFLLIILLVNVMDGKVKKGIIFIFVVFLVLIYTLAGTYATVIHVFENEGINEIMNDITVRDLLTNDDGTYNDTYYMVLNELDITLNEANLLIDSKAVNDNLLIILNNIVSYKLDEGIKFNNSKIINLIEDAVGETSGLSDNTKEKIINKSKIYIVDIINYLYEIDVVYG